MHNINTTVPRPPKRRMCRAYDGDKVFKPRSIPMTRLRKIRLELSELEAMRLCDHEGLDQTEAGARMKVSRGTVQRLLKQGRIKLLSAILSTSALLIEKGENDESLHPRRR